MGYCPFVLQEKNLYCKNSIVLQWARIILKKKDCIAAGLAGEAGCVTIQTLYRDCCCLNREDLYCKTQAVLQ